MNEFEYSKTPYNNKNNTNTRLLKIFTILILCFLAGSAGYFVSKTVNDFKNRNQGYLINNYQSNSNTSVDFNKYMYLLNKVQEVYPGEVNVNQMFESSLKGLLSGVGDAPTQYFSAADYQKFLALESGQQFSGIGIEFNLADQNLIKVINVFEGSPAKGVGLAVGDIILKVDDVTITGLTNEEIVTKIKGLKGSTVKLSVIRNNQQMDFKIVRDDIKIPPINYKTVGSIAVIGINRFTASTVAEWNKNWDEVVAQVLTTKPSGIVLDLRSNGGGYLSSSVYAASDFIDANNTIVSQKGKLDFANQENKSVAKLQRLKDFKTVILVDQYSASASEIFAGALQYYKKATVIGQNTYGKGTVQDIFDTDLKDGSAVKITIAHWVLPSGRIISKETPINPDVKIEQDVSALKLGTDNVLNKGLEILKQ